MTDMRILLATLCLLPVLALAQGQDGTPGERNRQIIASLLPGLYDNANQAYFDQRLNIPDAQRHAGRQLRITADADQPGSFLLAFTANDQQTNWRAGLRPATDPELTEMRLAFGDGRKDCVVLWRRDAGQFTGEGDCGLSLQLDPAGLWISDGSKRADRLLRAREFSCYVDVPGVAGGRDIPFTRYPIDTLHDQGGLHWLTIEDDREIGITLRRVRWPMNNETGAFTRDSLVMYVLEREAGNIRTHSYGWTEPDAERIGLNLQWLLVNCFLISNRDAKPVFD